MFRLFKKNREPNKLDFSNENIERFSELSDKIGDTLIKGGYGSFVDYLSQIRLKAENKNSVEFKRLVMSNSIFGGAGSLRDIWIEEEYLRNKFNNEFYTYLELLIKIGLDDKRILKEMKILKKHASA